MTAPAEPPLADARVRSAPVVGSAESPAAAGRVGSAPVVASAESQVAARVRPAQAATPAEPPPIEARPRPPAEPPLTDGERAELVWLRQENDFLRVQRDILLRVASGYAHDFETMSHRHP
jgi:hypothetical protein